MRKPKFDRKQQGRLKRLLDMEYKPSEIAEEIGITTETIYRGHMPAGAPFTKDNKGNVWINGLAYKKWVEDFFTVRRNTEPMPKDHAYCFTCKTARQIQNPKVRPYKQATDQVIGKCPVCGKKISRLLSKKEGGKL